MPREIVFKWGGSETARLCEDLLALGILQPGDWCGALDKSLARGLSRWGGEVAGEKQGIGLDIAVGNRLDRIHDEYGGEDSYMPEGIPSIPGIALVSPHTDHAEALVVYTKNRVEAMEHYLPGLGFGVLTALQEAIEQSAGGMTIRQARDKMDEWVELMVDNEPDETGHPAVALSTGEYLTMETFDAALPRLSWDSTLDRRFLRLYVPEYNADRGVAAERLPRWFANALSTTRELLDVLDDIPERSARLSVEGYGYPVAPFCVRWSPEDWVAAAYDDYHNMHFEDSALSRIVWVATWMYSDPVLSERERIGGVMRELRRAVRLVALCRRLALLLHTSPKTEAA